ncbi:Cyclin-T-1, partial [Tetrabaena socialis]
WRTTLCLQFSPAKIAVTALWMADLMNLEGGRVPSRLPHGAAFFDRFEMRPEELDSICNQMLAEYEHSKLTRLVAASGDVMPVVKAEIEGRLGIGPSQLGRPLPGPGAGVKMEEEEGELKE